MNEKEFIEKAIKGGWRVREKHVDIGVSQLSSSVDINAVLLDPKAWQAVGKVSGWDDIKVTMHFGGGALYLKCDKCQKDIGFREVDFHGSPEQQKQPRAELEVVRKRHLAKKHYIIKMHQMIDALAEGKSIREVLKDL